MGKLLYCIFISYPYFVLVVISCNSSATAFLFVLVGSVFMSQKHETGPTAALHAPAHVYDFSALSTLSL